jgi:transposase
LRWCKRGQKNQALGRSRGGFSSKIHVAVSEDGYPLRFRITAGQSGDILEMIPLLAQRSPDVVIADTAYDSNRIRTILSAWGTEIVIPNLPGRTKKFDLNKEKYKKRCAVEIFFNRIKQYRRVATRYDKNQLYYAAMVAIGCIKVALTF